MRKVLFGLSFLLLSISASALADEPTILGCHAPCVVRVWTCVCPGVSVDPVPDFSSAK